MEVKEARAAESSALNQIKIMFKRTNDARASTSESGAQITISREEFDSLSRKVGESDRLAEMKVVTAMAQVESVKASENEALKRLEATQEIDNIKAATQESLKWAEMAEAEKKAVEGELRRWCEHKQKKVAEAASRILAETKMSSGSSLTTIEYKTCNHQRKTWNLERWKVLRPWCRRKY